MKKENLNTKKPCTIDSVSKRYFIVMYVASVVRGTITGNLDVTTNGEYLNRELTTKNIKDSIEQDCSDIVVTNIIELNERDYYCW